MGESQYSYQGLPDPSSYFPGTRDPGEPTSTPGMLTTGTPNIMGTPNIFIHDNSALAEGLQTPNTRARRVVHEVIV